MKRFALLIGLLLLVFAPLAGAAQPVKAFSTISVSASCTLRDAVRSANRNQATGGCIAGTPGMDVIQIPAGTFTIEGAADEEQADTGDLDIREPLRIEGAGMHQTVIQSKDGNDRVFHIHPDNIVYFQNLTIRDGGLANAPASGGGIRSEASMLYLTGVRVVGNMSRETGGGIDAVFVVRNNQFAYPTTMIESSIIEGNVSHYGGGLYSLGAVVIKRSAVINNIALPGGNGSGGGLDNNDFSGLGMTIDTVTISGNTGRGAALSSSSVLNILNSTIYGNSGSEGLLINLGSLTTISGSIVAGTSGGPNCRNEGGQESMVSGGYNLDDTNTNTCSFGATDLIGVNPGLAALNTSGATPYFPLAAGSPAIDHGSRSLTCMGSMFDQRNANRPMNSRCDIGSYEVDGPYTPPNLLWLPSLRR